MNFAFFSQPLYHQPSDTANYESNKRRFYHGGLKAELIQRLKKDAADRRERVEKMTSSYSRLNAEWLKKVGGY